MESLPEGRTPSEAEVYFNALARSSTDAIIGCRQGTIIAFWNEAAERIFGFSANEIVGKPLAHIIPERFRDAHKRGVRRLLETGRLSIVGKIYELSGMRKDGSEFPIEFSYGASPKDGEMVIIAIIRDITERKRSEELSDALDRINSIIHSTLEFEEIMHKVVIQANQAIGTESASVILRENDYWVPRFSHRLPEEILEKPHLSAEEIPIAERILYEKAPIVVHDTVGDVRVNRRMVEPYSIRSILAIPLVVKDETAGILVFYRKIPAGFLQPEIDFAAKLGASISLAIENARLYVAQRNIADTLQKALLEIPETIPGVEFGHLYRSATEAAQVGGDFFDLFEIEPGKVGITIGDVSGKGLEAAALTSLVKDTIKAYAFRGDSPSAVMNQTNNLASKTLLAAGFITVFLGILDVKSGRLVYANAGHTTPIIKRKSSKTTLLTKRSIVIGAFPDWIYEEDEATLGDGELLILYTDGVVEARRDKEFFGEERLIDLVERTELSRPEEVPRSVFSNVLEFTGGKLNDDVAILAISLEK